MKLSLLAGAAVIAFAGFANAASTVDSDTTGLNQTDFSSLMIPGLADLPALELDLFDPSLGTLTGVKLTLEGSFVATGTVTSLGTSPVLTGFEQSVLLSGTSSIGGLTLNLDLSDGTTPMIFAPAQTEVVDLADDGMVMDTSMDFAAFTGPGTFNVDFFTLSGSTIIGGGNLEALISTNAEITATVEYTFDEATTPMTPVPLPATAPLLLAGLAGLGFLSRRRK